MEPFSSDEMSCSDDRMHPKSCLWTF